VWSGKMFKQHTLSNYEYLILSYVFIIII